jgi:hypothetical protein
MQGKLRVTFGICWKVFFNEQDFMDGGDFIIFYCDYKCKQNFNKNQKLVIFF